MGSAGWRCGVIQGMTVRVDAFLEYFRPAYQDCICGAMEVDYNESGARWYRPCCDRIYVDEQVVAVGKVWLDGALKRKTEPTSEQLLDLMVNCPVPPEGMTTSLYRRFDADETLLYLGISDDLRARSRWHERHSPWAPFVARRTTEWHATRAAAEAAERAVIKSERPLFNRQHGSRESRRAAVAYLLEKQRFLLVEEVLDDSASSQK